MRALIIDKEAQAEIARVCGYAETHRMNNFELRGRVELAETRMSVGDDPGHCCNIRQGFKAVLSIEEQNPPLGWCKHLSVSVAAIDKMPHIEAVKLLMQEFGLSKPMEECLVYVEDSLPKSVNVICSI